MDILGISCFFHDAAAALLRDGVLVAAAGHLKHGDLVREMEKRLGAVENSKLKINNSRLKIETNGTIHEADIEETGHAGQD